MIEKASRAAETAARVAVWAGGAMLLFAAVLVSTDVLLRKLFSFTFTGADEIAGYVFAISTTWAFAYVLVDRANVRIDAIYLLLPGWLRATLDVLALLVLGAFIGFFAWRAYGVLTTSLEMGARATTPLQTPVAVPQTLWLSGLVLFMLVWLVVLTRTIAAFRRGDLIAVNLIAGAPTLDEEVRHELETTEVTIERKRSV